MGKNPTDTILTWVISIASIAFILLMLVIIFGNLSGNLGFDQDTTTITVTNESDNSGDLVFINTTGYTLDGFNTSWSSITLTAIWSEENGNYNVTVGTGNGTVSSLGVLTNATTNTYSNASISYTYVYSFDSQSEVDTDNIINNYTGGAVNTADQFTTVGTILGVAILILILLALLVFVIKRMTGVTGKSKGSSGEFSEGGNFA